MTKLVQYLANKNPLRLSKIQKPKYDVSGYSLVVKSAFAPTPKEKDYSLAVRSCFDAGMLR